MKRNIEILEYCNYIQSCENVEDILIASCEVIAQFTNAIKVTIVSVDEYTLLLDLNDEPNTLERIKYNVERYFSEHGLISDADLILDEPRIYLMFNDIRALIYVEYSLTYDLLNYQLFLNNIVQQCRLAFTRIRTIGQINQLTFLLEQAVKRVSAKRGAIHRYSSDDKRLLYITSYNRGTGPLVDLHKGLSGYLVRSGQKYIIEPDYNASQWAHPAYDGNRDFPCTIKVLLKGDKQVFGVMTIDDELGRVFSEENIEELLSIANVIVHELNKSDIVKRIEQINDVTSQIANASVVGDIDATLDHIVVGIHRILQSTSATAYVYSAQKGYFELVVESGVVAQHIEKRGELIPEDSIFYYLHPDGQCHIVSDIHTDKFYKTSNFIQTESLKAYLAVPLKLKIQGDVRGIIFVNYDRKHIFTNDEISTVQLFANQATVAIENYQLRRKLKDSNTNLNKLYNASQQVNTSLDIEQTIQRTADEALSLIENKSDNFCISHITVLEKTHLRHVATSPKTESKLVRSKVIDPNGATITTGIIGRVSDSGETENIYPVKKDSDYVQLYEEVRSQLSVPITIGDRTIGVLSIEHSRAEYFSNDEVKNVESLAALAASAIGRAEILDQFSSLQQTSLDLTQALDSEALFEVILERACSMLNAESAGLREYDKEQGNLYLISRFRRKTRSQTLKVGEGYAGRLVEEGSPPYMIIPDYSKWIKDNGEEDNLRGLQDGAVLAVCLSWNDKPIGVLFVSDKLGRSFDIDDASKLIAIGHQVATALTYYRIIERLESVKQISNSVGNIIKGDDIRQVLNGIVTNARDIMRCDIVVLYLLDVKTGLLKNPAFHTKVRYPNQMKQEGVIPRSSAIYKILETNEPFIVDEPFKAVFARQDGGKFGKDFIEDEGIESYIALTLRADNEALGVMFAHYCHKHRFIDREVDDLKFFVRQATVAILSRQSVEEVRQISRRYKMLIDINMKIITITQANQLPELFEAIVDGASELMQLKGGAHITGVVHRIVGSYEDGYWIEKSHAYPRNGLYVASRLHEKVGVTHKVVSERNAFVVEKLDKSNQFVHPELYGKGIRSMVALPLDFEDEILGVLFLNSTQSNTFGQSLGLLNDLANYAASAIHFAKQYRNVERFIQLAAHEIRKPLARMVAVIDNFQADPIQRREIYKISSSIKYLQFTTDNIFNLDSIREGQIKPNFKLAEFTQVVEEVIDMMEPIIPSINEDSRIKFSITPESIFVVKVDKLMMTYVMLNLVHNAIKFSNPRGIVTIKCDEILLENSAKLIVSVQDFGIGMSTEEMNNIFDWKYTGEDGERQSTKGMGIGMFIVKQFLDAHKVTLNTKSVIGKGTEFTFLLDLY